MKKIEFDLNETKQALYKINERKATGPDGLSGKLLKVCANELSFIFNHLFNMSMSYNQTPTIWKTSKIIPVPKKDKITTINDLRPIALTPIIMKCYERLVLSKLGKQLKPHLDKLQFAYQPKRSVEDALLVFTNNIYEHLDKPKSYCRILFVDFSSAFNTIKPHLLIEKLCALNINKNIISWVLNFMTNRPQFVYTSKGESTQLVINTGAPQGCVISPVLFTAYTNDCTSTKLPLLKFADDTALQGLIIGEDETSYFSETDKFVTWCDTNALNLNVSKTKELIIDFRHKQSIKRPLVIKDEVVEQVSEYKYLGIIVDDKLRWSNHIEYTLSKVNKRMYFLRKLKEFKIDKTLITLFYKAAIESMFSFCITVWGGNSYEKDNVKIEKTIKRAKRFTNPLCSFSVLFQDSCKRKVTTILKDNTHPLYHKINPSNRSNRLRSILTKTERHKSSFLPYSVRLYNSSL